MSDAAAPIANMDAEDIDSIINELAKTHDRLPVEAIQAARRHKEQIIPRLIQGVYHLARAWKPDTTPVGNLAFFALYLLTEFRAKEGLPAILEAISLPDEGPFDLFG